MKPNSRTSVKKSSKPKIKSCFWKNKNVHVSTESHKAQDSLTKKVEQAGSKLCFSTFPCVL